MACPIRRIDREITQPGTMYRSFAYKETSRGGPLCTPDVCIPRGHRGVVEQRSRVKRDTVGCWPCRVSSTKEARCLQELSRDTTAGPILATGSFNGFQIILLPGGIDSATPCSLRTGGSRHHGNARPRRFPRRPTK